MRVMITGAAGNLGGFLAQAMMGSPHKLRLMIHRKPIAYPFVDTETEIARADLDSPATLVKACQNVDCIVHFAGVLFRPRPERFLPRTNVDYVANLLEAARAEGVGKFILISFPHVEGESTPDQPAAGRLQGSPASIHAQTRLSAERLVHKAGETDKMQTICLRPGMIYGKGVLMIEAARRLMRWGMLPVWRKPTWIHLIALPDFNRAVMTTIAHPSISGIVNLGDEKPLTLQTFLDLVARHWGYPRPPRVPSPAFYLAAALVEGFAGIFGTAAPITRDFIRIGMASYTMDTSRMREELLPELAYPTIQQGLNLL